MADMVEVVRCKDCQYWQDKNSKGTQGICLCGKKIDWKTIKGGANG